MKPIPCDGLILDMDGVLLDTGPSFSLCVLETAKRLADPPLGPGWSLEDEEALRLAGGFNNDVDAAVALALLGPASSPGEGWKAVCQRLKRRGGGPDAVMVFTGSGAWNAAWSRAYPLFAALYAGKRAPEVYGLPASQETGLCENEVPLVSPEELSAPGLPFGVFTGRNPGEARLGLARLGLDLPPERLVADSAPRFRKPNPDGVLELARRLGSQRPLVVGDSVDDLGATVAARRRGLMALFAGIAPPGSERERRFKEGGADAVAPSLRQILRRVRRGGAP
jgi:HAD superfamily hydrolase (TIGR01548 family)